MAEKKKRKKQMERLGRFNLGYGGGKRKKYEKVSAQERGRDYFSFKEGGRIEGVPSNEFFPPFKGGR